MGQTVEERIMGLNAMYSGGEVEPALTCVPPSGVQQAVMDHILNSVKLLGPPPSAQGRYRAASGF